MIFIFALLECIVSLIIQFRAISSVGSEHLPYKQGVTGSNPVSPTKYLLKEVFFFGTINSVGLECYLDRVEVTGSNPVWSTSYLT